MLAQDNFQQRWDELLEREREYAQAEAEMKQHKEALLALLQQPQVNYDEMDEYFQQLDDIEKAQFQIQEGWETL